MFASLARIGCPVPNHAIESVYKPRMRLNDISNLLRRSGAGIACHVAGFLLAGCLIQGLTGSAEAAAASTSRSAKQGAEIFQKRCVACHNKQPGDDAPFGPPNLHTVFHRTPPLSEHEAETTIHDGKGNMPAFGSILTQAEIRSVIAYLRKR